MRMHQPDLGDYVTIKTVVAYQPPSRIGWGPSLDPTSPVAGKLGEMDASGHTFTYDLQEVEGGTEVTVTYDWTGVKDPNFAAMLPLVSQEQLTRSPTGSPRRPARSGGSRSTGRDPGGRWHGGGRLAYRAYSSRPTTPPGPSGRGGRDR
jgi:hypothetical protein